MASESVATPNAGTARSVPDVGDLINTLSALRRPGSLEHIQRCGQAAYNSLEALWGGFEAIGELMEIAGDNEDSEVSQESILRLGSFMRMLAKLGEALTLTQSNADFWEKNESADDAHPSPPEPEDFGPQHKTHMAAALNHLERADKIRQRVLAKRKDAEPKAAERAAA